MVRFLTSATIHWSRAVPRLLVPCASARSQGRRRASSSTCVCGASWRRCWRLRVRCQRPPNWC